MSILSGTAPYMKLEFRILVPRKDEKNNEGVKEARPL